MKLFLVIVGILAQVAFASARPIYNIKDYGAKGNGKI